MGLGTKLYTCALSLISDYMHGNVALASNALARRVGSLLYLVVN